MSESIALLFAQINPVVGAIEGNAQQMADIISHQQALQDCIVFPELCLSGYPPEDLLFKPNFHQRVERALAQLIALVEDCYVIIPHPAQLKGQCFNRATVCFQGKVVCHYDKRALPNYGVFDEQRYFTPGELISCRIEIKGQTLGLCICEDMWQAEVVELLISQGIDHLLCINASPFEQGKFERRLALAQRYANQGINILYLNLCGGQDELVFDGRSFAMDCNAKLCVQLSAFKPQIASLQLSLEGIKGPYESPIDSNALLYQALVTATQDYVNKNGFPGVLIGLSGGIDSALTLAIAVDALGEDCVHAVMMPSRYTSDMSVEDATAQIKTLGVGFTVLDIEPSFAAFSDTLAPSFTSYEADKTEENIQARIRGTLLMALSNKWGHMVLNTSNKSETAVGYSTLYGDMVGGFSVLKDVLKTQVYALAKWRNSVGPIIPERVISRAPSAELADNQKDQDSLPDYAILDAIIQAIMEENADRDLLLARNFPAQAIEQTLTLIARNEYKRRQSALGPKVSARAFGKDWRQPICKED